MGQEEKLYIEQMESWVEEQAILEHQIRRTIRHHKELADDHKKVAALNEIQLKAHVDRVKLGIQEFENWKKDNNIKGDVE